MTEAATDHGRARRPAPRLHRLAGWVLVVWFLWELVLLSVLGTDPVGYNRLVEASGEVAPRLVVAAALVVLVFHGLDGLRLVVVDAGASRRVARVSRVVVVFLVAASCLPLVALVLRAHVEEWLA